ncbi:MAG: glycosyltransferase [Desulfovibrionaceae bacterium]|nr:glycosyltransferase [Desulfovibrionaceae bacterium]
MSADLLKHCWKASPQWVRLLFLKGLCLARVQKRVAAAARNTPFLDGPFFVCGAFGSKSGLGQGARLYAQNCQQQGRPVCAVDITAAMRLKRDMRPAAPALDVRHLSEHMANLTGGGTVIIHANPPQFQLALCALGKKFLQHKKVVGYWAWELESLPPVWQQALDYVDAVEVPSRFVQHTLQTYTDKAVTVIPHQGGASVTRKTAHATDGVLRCLYIFDAASSFERKNPLAALRAFAQAFAPGEAGLTFKVSNAQADARQFAAFREACARVPGVRIVTETLDTEGLEKLYLAHDVYLSLHRSEGFGLTIYEAMRHGLHVVATGWSGNMDFMHGPLAHAVPYELRPVCLSGGPCKGLRARWAEADIDAAAGILNALRRQLCGGNHA